MRLEVGFLYRDKLLLIEKWPMLKCPSQVDIKNVSDGAYRVCVRRVGLSVGAGAQKSARRSVS